MRLAPLALAALLSACSSAPPRPAAPGPAPSGSAGAQAAPPPADAWVSRLDAASPLVGKIWDVQAHAFIDEAAFLQKARAAAFVLLGEKHDNPDHHRLQARVIEGLTQSKNRPAVVFEMIEVEQQKDLDAYLQAHPGGAEGLGAALSWERRGWPSWPTYRPIAEAAFKSGLKLVAGNIAASEARAVVKSGLDALGPERLDGWRLREPLPPAARALLEEEMRASHCGQLPEKIIPGMADAQRARDAAMADRLISNESSGAVLISGAGHARTDRGVPLYLRARRPAAAVVSVAFQEVQAGQSEPGEGFFNYLWFTPRLDNNDPCEKMLPRPSTIKASL